VPNFKLVSWVARPAGMNAEGGGEFDSPPEPAPVRKAAKPAPAPVMDDEEFF
jgi:hypothetical protein